MGSKNNDKAESSSKAKHRSKKASKKKQSHEESIPVDEVSAQLGCSAGESENASTGTGTTSESGKTRGKRGVVQMYKVLVRKALNKKVSVSYNRMGNPCGKTRPTLQSYIGMLARKMVPINIESWPKVGPDLKEKLWKDIQVLDFQFGI